MSDDPQLPVDPPRWADDPAAPEAFRASAWAGLAPPPLPGAVRERVRRALRARTTRRAVSRWWPAFAAAVLVLGVLTWRRSGGPAQGVPRERVALRPDPAAHLEGPARVVTTDAAVSDADASSLATSENLPVLLIAGTGCGLDVRVPLTRIDEQLASVALVLRERPLADVDQGPVEADCRGVVVREIDAAVFRAAAPLRSGSVALDLRVELAPPVTRCDASYTVVACGRDARGRLSVVSSEPAWPRQTAYDEQTATVEEVATPSGPAMLGDVFEGHALNSLLVDARGGVTASAPAPISVRVLHTRYGPAEPTGATQLRLATGRVVHLASAARVWLANRGRFVAAREVRAGDAALGEEGPVVIRSTFSIPDGHPQAFLDVSWPDTYLLGGIVVHDDGPDSAPAAPVARAAVVDEPVRVVPAHADACLLRADVEVTSLAPDIESVAVRYAPAQQPAGTRAPMRCDEGALAVELPRALLEAVPERVPGRRVVSVEVQNDFSRAGRRHRAAPALECETGYVMLACLRGTDGGLYAVPGAQGRWAYSGPTCFAGGTRVTTLAGDRAIETLREGAAIVTRDERTGARVVERVRALIPRGVRSIRSLVLANGATLRVTDEHPLYDARERHFRRAGSFLRGDVLLGGDGEPVPIVAVVDVGEKAPVFDLSVTGLHTFVASGVLVHNY